MVGRRLIAQVNVVYESVHFVAYRTLSQTAQIGSAVGVYSKVKMVS